MASTDEIALAQGMQCCVVARVAVGIEETGPCTRTSVLVVTVHGSCMTARGVRVAPGHKFGSPGHPTMYEIKIWKICSKVIYICGARSRLPQIINCAGTDGVVCCNCKVTEYKMST